MSSRKITWRQEQLNEDLGASNSRIRQGYDISISFLQQRRRKPRFENTSAKSKASKRYVSTMKVPFNNSENPSSNFERSFLSSIVIFCFAGADYFIFDFQ